ncbi:MAG: hypothetical protein ACJ796_22755 [Gemmatimonadaceae bacterium]
MGSTASTEAESHSLDAPHHEHVWAEAIEAALRLPSPPAGFWYRVGISGRAERRLEIVLGVLLYTLAVGWVWSLSHLRTSESAQGSETAVGAAARTAATIATALTSASAPSTAYLADATINALFERARGISGKLRATIDTSAEAIDSDSLPSGAQIRYSVGGDVTPTDTATPSGAGVWSIALAIGNAIRPVADFSVITELPFRAKSGGKIGLYYIGNWPAERSSKRSVAPAKAPPTAYANPAGFIKVTQDNADTYVSEHFKLRDFLTHDQPNVWPKYLVLQLRLVDKLELILADLTAHGVDVSGVRVMSGFRTPRYNASGGNPQGRAALSRHMYGDASDIFIDSNHDGVMDDLNHDGHISMTDSKVIEAAVDRVEAAHPELVGGAGIYPAGPGHGPFIHIDTRGYRARWTGGPGGG